MDTSPCVRYWTCTHCKSAWPAATTVEAWRNNKRANELHPGKPCEKAESMTPEG